MKKFLLFLLLAGIPGLWSCDGEQPPQPIVYAYVNKVIDLNNLTYQKLKFDRGALYEEGGAKGLIIYRKSASVYLVFERTCTYYPESTCKVNIDGSTFFMTDPCCKSQFDFDGNPMGGPAVHPLVQYRTALSGSLLYITN